MQCFWCNVVSGKLTLLEAEDARWLTKDTIESVDWLPADKELVQKIKESM
jgi:8-oxo-dGTP diphosphatase